MSDTPEFDELVSYLRSLLDLEYRRGQANAPGTIEKTQRERFIEAARKAGCSEDEVVFDENLRRIAKAKPRPRKKPSSEITLPVLGGVELLRFRLHSASEKSR